MDLFVICNQCIRLCALKIHLIYMRNIYINRKTYIFIPCIDKKITAYTVYTAYKA